METRVHLNEGKNGVEIYFSAKPSEDILSLIKQHGFRFSRPQCMWYAKQSPERIAFAESLAIERESTSSEPNTAAYMPSYTMVDRIPIFKSADESAWENKKGYFADLQALIENHNSEFIITDLRNALTPGKTCERIIVGSRCDQTNPAGLFNGIKTFRDVYERYFVNRLTPEGCTITAHSEKSNTTFTPFKEIKRIKTPDKWTIPHLWKAMLTGQIFHGWIDGVYTDDYAYDAHVNFHTGSEMHLPSFAKQLIESPSGWWVQVDKKDGHTAQLSINCHSFDHRTVVFDANCTLEEAEKRSRDRETKRDEHNQQMLSQVKPDLCLDPLKLYFISYIEMDHNTKMYEKRDAFISGGVISDECDYDGCPIIEAEEKPILADRMYQIFNTHSRLRAGDESRFIHVHEKETYVTGYALQELLSEGSALRCSWQPINSDELRSDLMDFLTKRKMILFSKANIDYAAMIGRLDAELSRITAKEAIHESP